MAIWENKEGKPDWLFIGLMSCVFMCCLVPQCNGGGGSSSSDSTPTYEYTPTAPTATQGPTTPAPPSPSSYWSGSSNGHTWNRATYAQKKWICDRMASVSNKGGTSDYYMNFYNNFYGSTATDSTSMDDASRLAEAGL